jgi:hypothetical protein
MAAHAASNIYETTWRDVLTLKPKASGWTSQLNLRVTGSTGSANYVTLRAFALVTIPNVGAQGLTATTLT